MYHNWPRKKEPYIWEPASSQWARAFLNLCQDLEAGSWSKIVCSTGFPGLDWRYVSASYHGVLPVLPLHFLALSVFFFPLLFYFLLSFFLYQCCQACPRHTVILINIAYPHLNKKAERLLSMPRI